VHKQKGRARRAGWAGLVAELDYIKSGFGRSVWESKGGDPSKVILRERDLRFATKQSRGPAGQKGEYEGKKTTLWWVEGAFEVGEKFEDHTFNYVV